MKNYQKILCLLLTICMLTALYSCSGETQEPVSEVTETTVETAAETSYFESFEKKDYEGYKFRIISYDIFENFAEDSENGDIVNDTLYRRDNTIAELLNIEFVKQEESGGNVNDIIKKCVTAGEDAYDLVYTSFDNGVSLLASSVLADLNTMPNLNFAGEHWSALLNESLSFNGKQFFASGDILPTFFYVPNSVVYNMDKLAEYGFDSTPYEDVKNGSWTYDAFYNYIINTERDLDGDGKITIENDFVPFAYTNIALEGLYVSGGNYFTKKDPDKGISVDVIDDRTTSAIEKLKNVFSDSNICLPGQGNDQGTSLKNKFFRPRVLWLRGH